MAGIYSQGGSAGHRYAGWLSEVEAKNFQFGGKVFNGSPSAIYVGSNLVWFASWLTGATQKAILAAFGQTDGWAVIQATNAYLNQLAVSDRDKAQAIADFMNESPTHAVGYARFIYEYQEVEYISSNGNQWIYYPFAFADNIEYFRMKFALGSLGLAWALGSWTDSSGNYGLNIDGYNGCRFCLGYGNVNDFNLSSWNLAANTLYDIEWENGQVKMEGKTPLSVNAGKPSNNAISIFALYNPNKYGSYSGKFGGLRLKAGASETWPIPCYNKTSGTIGAYDVANDVFRTNAGSGTFGKGADVTP